MYSTRKWQIKMMTLCKHTSNQDNSNKKFKMKNVETMQAINGTMNPYHRTTEHQGNKQIRRQSNSTGKHPNDDRHP